MKVGQIGLALLGSLIVTLGSVVVPINGLKIAHAAFCGVPAGLPFAFTLANWRHHSSLFTCMTVLSPQTILTSFLLDFVIWFIVIFLLLKLLRR